MIGILAKPDQANVVEEFFELFKTPWEFYCPGRSYDAIITTTDEVPLEHAKLVLAYGTGTKSVDSQLGTSPEQLRTQGTVSDQRGLLPVYCGLTAFSPANKTIVLRGGSGAAGVAVHRPGAMVIRIGYDLFEEVRFLLTEGQPAEYAHIPTLDRHIQILRGSILGAGVALLEIPPVPAGYSFTVCLTHDIDFTGIRNHRFDHTMWGFLYRSTFESVVKLIRGRISLGRLVRIWRAAASLPLVYLGWVKDFWEPFQWYLEVERDLATTYFLIPFKGRPGEKVPSSKGYRRAAAYDLESLSSAIESLEAAGCELGVHGIDAWHSTAKGREEMERIAQVTHTWPAGVRMHWLLRDKTTYAVLEQSGYDYDSTVGYNETVGYRAGTTQVFRPLGAQNLMELPVHIQDGALFYPDRLDFSEQQAQVRCEAMIGDAKQFGGVLTAIWHDRSHAPERLWGDFYVGFLQELKSSRPWFATAGQAAKWSRKRRAVRFERCPDARGVKAVGANTENESVPPLNIRIHQPTSTWTVDADRLLEQLATDSPWGGSGATAFDSSLRPVTEASVELSPL